MDGSKANGQKPPAATAKGSKSTKASSAAGKGRGVQASEERKQQKKYKSMRAVALEEKAREHYELTVRMRAEAQAKARAEEQAAIEAAEQARLEAIEATRLEREQEEAEREANAVAVEAAQRLVVSPRAYRLWKSREDYEQKLRSCSNFRKAMDSDWRDRSPSPPSTHRSQLTQRSACISPLRTPMSPSPFRSPAGALERLAIGKTRAKPSVLQRDDSVSAPDTPASKDTQLPSKGSTVRHAVVCEPMLASAASASAPAPASAVVTNAAGQASTHAAPAVGASPHCDLGRGAAGSHEHPVSAVELGLLLSTIGVPIAGTSPCADGAVSEPCADGAMSEGNREACGTATNEPTDSTPPAATGPVAAEDRPAGGHAATAQRAHGGDSTPSEGVEAPQPVVAEAAVADGVTATTNRRAEPADTAAQSSPPRKLMATPSARTRSGSSARTATSERTAAALSADSARTSLSTHRRKEWAPHHGWVTLALGDAQYVERRVARLPAAIRQQHLDHWSRRGAMDSARERERAKTREEDVSRDRWRETPYFTQDASHRRCATRPVYLDELEADPRGIGFAYGGLNPGRLHAHGRLVDVHQAHFSVGLAGSYELHVALRHDSQSTIVSTPLPGSPFSLTVLPGPAHPLSTELPLVEGPSLVGEVEAADDVELAVLLKLVHEPMKGCTLLLPSRDKMGNLCCEGGAVVTCGVVAGSTVTVDADGEAIEPRADPNVQGRSIDLGDGTYSLRWWAFASCACEVWVKMDGLQVLGSPAPLVFKHATEPRIGADGLRSPQRSPPLSIGVRPLPIRPGAIRLTYSARAAVQMGREQRRSGEGGGHHGGHDRTSTGGSDGHEATCGRESSAEERRTAAAIKLQSVQRAHQARMRRKGMATAQCMGRNPRAVVAPAAALESLRTHAESVPVNARIQVGGDATE